MKISVKTLISAVSLLAFPFQAMAQSVYVDVGNSSPNAQVHYPVSGYAYYPSADYSGAGISHGFGVYYIADGFLTGSTHNGLWQSSWLDALPPAPDAPPHGGSGTVDVIAPGGTGSSVTGFTAGNGLPAASPDTNSLYLGIYGEPLNDNYSEYGLWDTALVVSATTTFQYSYQWAAAGGTLTDGTEVMVGAGMGAQFFLDTDRDYSNGGIVFAESSGLEIYNGAGTQTWLTETGTFTLAPGSYYWGFSAEGNAAATYITVDNISIAPVPEPSSALLLGLTGIMLVLRRRSWLPKNATR